MLTCFGSANVGVFTRRRHSLNFSLEAVIYSRSGLISLRRISWKKHRHIETSDISVTNTETDAKVIGVI